MRGEQYGATVEQAEGPQGFGGRGDGLGTGADVTVLELSDIYRLMGP